MACSSSSSIYLQRLSRSALQLPVIRRTTPCCFTYYNHTATFHHRPFQSRRDHDHNNFTTTTTNTPSDEENEITIEGLRVDHAEEEEEQTLSRWQVNELYRNRNKIEFQEPIEITMPDVGQGDVRDGTLVQWFREPGDYIETGTVLCEIETQAFSFQLEMEDEELGLLHEIYVPAGTTDVRKGTLLAKILHSKKSEQ